MDILNNSNLLNGGSNGSPDLLKSKNSNTNFALDSDSSHSFNSISSTPNSLISTPSPSSTDNNSLGNSHNNLSQSSNANSDTFSLMLQHYSLLSNTGANNMDSFSQYFNADTGNNLLNGYLHEMNFNNRFNGTSPSKSHKSSNNIVGANILTNNASGNTSMPTGAGSSRKKQVSNVSPNSAANLSSKSNGNNSIPPGLGGYIGKNSTMANGQAMNSNNNKPKNLRTLMNSNNNIMNSNSKMRLTNGDVSNKFPDGLYSPIAGATLNSLQSSVLPPQPSSFSNFQLPNGENFDLPFSRSNCNNFMTSSLTNSNSSTWNMKGDQDTSTAFDELLGGTSPFKSRDKINPAGEIGSGVKSDMSDPLSNLDSFLSGLSISKSDRDIWLQDNEASSNSQLGSFYSNIPARDLITSGAVSPSSTSTSNAPSNLFENAWSPSSPSANAFNAWGDTFSLPTFANDTGIALETRNSTSISSAGDFDIKKLMNNEKAALASLLDNNSTQFDMKGRTQLNDILTMFKKYIFEAIVAQDISLCQNNFDNYFGMMKTDLAKFEASTFTIEELKLFQGIYTSLVHGRDKFAEEKLALDANLEHFNNLIKNLLLSSAPSNVFMFDDNLLRKVADKLVNTFNVLYSAKHNNTFLNLVKFYKKMIYSIPTEILNNLPTIIQQSKLMNENCGQTGDPLFTAYRNFIIELNKHSQNRNAYPNNHEEDEVDSADNGAPPNIKNIRPSDTARNNKDVNNNKKIDALKGGNKVPSDKESDIKSMQAKQSCNKPQAPPIFSHVTQVKSEPSVYMPFYYPFDHNMLNLNGPISIFCNRIKVKAPYYLSPNRQTFDFIVDGELTKVMPGPIVLEKSENLTSNKSFNKLMARLKKHFPNLSIKQLVDLTLQSKYAIMKKHKLQYGFSGFKLKDLVRYIAEYIYENVSDPSEPKSSDRFSLQAIVSSMHGSNSAAAAALAAKGVSWSKVASASNIAQPNGQVMMSPSTSGTKDSASVVSSNASPSPSPSLSSNPSTLQICALCKNIIINNATDEKMKMAVVACSHIFHKECIDFWTKINPVCPSCDQFILRNEEFPSL